MKSWYWLDMKVKAMLHWVYSSFCEQKENRCWPLLHVQMTFRVGDGHNEIEGELKTEYPATQLSWSSAEKYVK